MPDSSEPTKQQTAELPDSSVTSSAPENELTGAQLDSVVGGAAPLPTTNLANMRHEALKAIAQNLRA